MISSKRYWALAKSLGLAFFLELLQSEGEALVKCHKYTPPRKWPELATLLSLKVRVNWSFRLFLVSKTEAFQSLLNQIFYSVLAWELKKSSWLMNSGVGHLDRNKI